MKVEVVTADWCGKCRQAKKILEGYDIRWIDADSEEGKEVILFILHILSHVYFNVFPLFGRGDTIQDIFGPAEYSDLSGRKGYPGRLYLARVVEPRLPLPLSGPCHHLKQKCNPLNRMMD